MNHRYDRDRVLLDGINDIVRKASQHTPSSSLGNRRPCIRELKYELDRVLQVLDEPQTSPASFFS